MKKLVYLSMICFFGLVLKTQAQTGNAKDGERKTATCVACHGPKGQSVNPLWPNLAGQKKDYLKKQLQDFKAGRRVDPMMAPMAMTLSEQDMDDLAAYYSSL